MPGGQTALALHGFAHYLPMAERTTHLYGKEAARLPRWLNDAEWAGRMVIHSEKGLPVQLTGSFTSSASAVGRSYCGNSPVVPASFQIPCSMAMLARLF